MTIEGETKKIVIKCGRGLYRISRNSGEGKTYLKMLLDAANGIGLVNAYCITFSDFSKYDEAAVLACLREEHDIVFLDRLSLYCTPAIRDALAEVSKRAIVLADVKDVDNVLKGMECQEAIVRLEDEQVEVEAYAYGV